MAQLRFGLRSKMQPVSDEYRDTGAVRKLGARTVSAPGTMTADRCAR
jgi:hypothetical protein